MYGWKLLFWSRGAAVGVLVYPWILLARWCYNELYRHIGFVHYVHCWMLLLRRLFHRLHVHRRICIYINDIEFVRHNDWNMLCVHSGKLLFRRCRATRRVYM
jgi:hypothetical protein